MRTHTSTVRMVTLLAALPAAGACAHAAFQQPDDPVEEARLLLSDLTAAEGGTPCAAEKVEQAWVLDALTATRPEESARGVRADQVWRGRRAEGLNLSQASAMVSGAWDDQDAAAQARRAGEPGARLRSYRAMQAFDAYADAAGSTGVRSVPAGEASPADAAWAAARYASVWTEYFGTEDAEARDQLLDWLTTRSMDNGDVLRAYHDDFAATLRNACG